MEWVLMYVVSLLVCLGCIYGMYYSKTRVAFNRREKGEIVQLTVMASIPLFNIMVAFVLLVTAVLDAIDDATSEGWLDKILHKIFRVKS